MNTLCKSCRQKTIQPVMPNVRPGEGRWVSEAEFERRVRICLACPALQADTCTHCGCLVRYRAALKDKACPCPTGNRWE